VTWKWLTPADGLPIHNVNRVELLSLVSQSPAPEDGWPESFWPHVARRLEAPPQDATLVIAAFRDLEPGSPARCHMPPWGLAFYQDDLLLVTTTLCFACSNAYVHSGAGTDLRAFDLHAPNAVLLRSVLERHLEIRES
jgi:hypothetical protein